MYRRRGEERERLTAAAKTKTMNKDV